MSLNTISWGIFLGPLLCWSCPVSGEQRSKIDVSIAGETVTLRCSELNATWYIENMGKYKKMDIHSNLLHFKKKEVNGQYACKVSGTNITSVYLKIRVCDSCLELSLGLGAGIIISDLLITLGVLLMVYYCRKKQVARLRGGAAGGGTRGWSHSQKTDSPPPVPNPDYEPIRKGQREVYAGLEPSRAF